jgi:phosphoribosyl-ATP pyrophosphohydrolase/phosphoribosyl-AMP cyclohydrolase
LWEKGATSGNYLLVHEVRWDCDADALLYRVKPCGPACHTGAASCFYQGQVLEPEPSPWILTELYDLVLSRMAERPAGSYVTKLLEQGRSRILQKVGEEATEVILAGAFERHDEVVAEAADLLFHLVVMLGELGVAPGEIWRELQQRRR